MPEFREWSPELSVESKKSLRYLKADLGVHKRPVAEVVMVALLGKTTRWFCYSPCTQVMQLSSKFLQGRLGRISTELPSDTTFLDSESVAGEKSEVAGGQLPLH